MSEIRINLDEKTHEKLKKFAEADDRSLTKYIQRGLVFLSNIPDGYHKHEPDDYKKSNSTNSLDLTQLQQEYNIQQIKFDKSATTPEEQNYKQQQLLAKTDKILQDREKKWFRRAKELLSDYWDDEECKRFAHNYIYGDYLYNLRPDDPAAIQPEPDDTRLDTILASCLNEEIAEANDMSKEWDRILQRAQRFN